MKRKFQITCVLSVMLLLATHIKTNAQDPHFSQYFASPMTLNPALIGKGVEDLRISSVFRSQWWGSSTIEPYNTTTVSFEKRLLADRPGGNSLAIGGSLLSDASNGGLLKNNYFSFGVAYNKALDANGTELLGGGLSVTYANRIFDPSKFQFESQFGSMGFQRVPSNDPVSIAAKHYWDVNAGLHYSKIIKNWGYDIGVSVYHAGTPKEAEYNNETYKLDLRTSVQAGLQFTLNNRDQFYISAVAESQSKNNIYTLGGVYKIGCNDETVSSINIGLWDRFGDALYPYAAVEGKKWLAGISYDIVNTAGKDWAQSVSSLEFSFVLKLGSAKRASASAGNVLFY